MAAGTAVDWREGLDAGDLSSEALVRASLERIRTLDPALGAIVSMDEARSLALAREADRRLLSGERSPVLGLPVVLKDNLQWHGLPASCASRIQDGYRSPYDATVVSRLVEKGAVPLGKTNLDEFAMGSSGEYSALKVTLNPWDAERVPGGSSSGSAAAVAAGYAPLALGSDTGGSVRLPAAFCQVTALRPTYGVLSRYGLTAMASSLDQVGPLGTSAADVALALSAMAGPDPRDSTSLDLPGKDRLTPLRSRSLRGLRVGLPRQYYGEGIQPGTRQRVEEALSCLQGEGAVVMEVDLPHTRYAIDTYYLLCTSEASSNLSRFDGVRFGRRAEEPELGAMLSVSRDQGFGPEVKRRILLGAFCLSKGSYEAFYLKAMKARTLIARDFDAAFAEVDLLLTPVSPDVAFPFGTRTDDPLAMYLADIYTVPAPLAGLPCLSLPASLDGGLPVGIQLTGPALSDVFLLEVAHAYQSLTRHHLAAPSLPA